MRFIDDYSVQPRPTTVAELGAPFLKVWARISMAIINRLIHSMHRRCVAVINTNVGKGTVVIVVVWKMDIQQPMQSVPITTLYHIDGVMVSVLASSVVDRGFESRSGQTKDYEIGICCFSSKHAALWRKESGIMCLSGVTCLSVDCCFSELAP